MGKLDDKKSQNYQNNFNKEYLENDLLNEDLPSTAPKNVSVEVLENLHLISEVFEKIEGETAETAEKIFDYLIDVDDNNIFS